MRGPRGVVNGIYKGKALESQMTGLKPCPFCGDDMQLTIGWEKPSTYWGECQSCDTQGPSCENPEDAFTAWNTRSSWQPIETAPKDGTWVLICTKDDVFEAAWVKGLNDEDYCWRFVDFSPHNPTHWQPLPDPPVDP